MASESIGQVTDMPSIEDFDEHNDIQNTKNLSNAPETQAATKKSSPSQHSNKKSKGKQSQVRSKATQGPKNKSMKLLDRPRLQQLVHEVDPTCQLDEEVEEFLLQFADDYMNTSLSASCLLARQRQVPNVELKDIKLHLGTSDVPEV